MPARLTPKAQKQLEESFRLRREAIEILGLVVAEWNTDPTSVQCFDTRIVERAKFVVARLKQVDIFG